MMSLAEQIYNSDSRSDLDAVFNQVSPYNYPPLIICRDPKKDNINTGIYMSYMDAQPIIINGCEEIFNTRNPSTSATLQSGFARNIDLDSELKHINYYEDKGYHKNRKIDPYTAKGECNGLKLHAQDLVKDYSSVGDIPNMMCVDYYPPTQEMQLTQQMQKVCNNINPDSRGFNGVISDRYDFSFLNNIQRNTGFSGVRGDVLKFEKAPTPNITGSNYVNNSKREAEVIKGIQNDVRYKENIPTYYKFHGGMMNNNCDGNKYTSERLFNNITRRSMLPNLQNLTDINL